MLPRAVMRIEDIIHEMPSAPGTISAQSDLAIIKQTITKATLKVQLILTPGILIQAFL